MTDSQGDDRDLDDAYLSRLYCELSDERPSPPVEQAIFRELNRSLKTPSGTVVKFPRWRQRWVQASLASAAVLVLVVTMLLPRLEVSEAVPKIASTETIAVPVATTQSVASVEAPVAELKKRFIEYAAGEGNFPSSGTDVVMAHVQYLKENPSAHVLLLGFADDDDPAEGRAALARYRAEGVRAFMVFHGAPVAQVDVAERRDVLAAPKGTARRGVEVIYRAGEPVSSLQEP